MPFIESLMRVISLMTDSVNVLVICDNGFIIPTKYEYYFP
jgi:hypothetical protein